MARQIWLKAEVYGLETGKDGILRPLARCGHYEAGPDMIWAPLDEASRITELECWTQGIVNSSNNVLVYTSSQDYAPLGKADGQARVVFGMQIRDTRNEFSRDTPVQFLPTRENAERMCRLHQKFCGLSDDLATIAQANSLKPDLLSLKQLVFLANMVEAYLRKEIAGKLELEKSVIQAIRHI